MHSLLITGDTSGKIKLWQHNAKYTMKETLAHDAEVSCVEWHEPTQQLATASTRGAVKIWSIKHADETPIELIEVETFTLQRVRYGCPPPLLLPSHQPTARSSQLLTPRANHEPASRAVMRVHGIGTCAEC
jgi:WD40 repeat protein